MSKKGCNTLSIKRGQSVKPLTLKPVWDIKGIIALQSILSSPAVHSIIKVL